MSTRRISAISIGGPVGKPGGSNKLFFFYSARIRAAHRGGNDVTLPRADRARARRATSRRRSTTTATCFRSSRIRSLPARARPRTRRRASRRRRARPHSSRTGCIRPGLNILKMYPLPNVDAPAQSYNYEIIRPAEKLRANQPAVRLDYQPMSSLRGTFKSSGWSSSNSRSPVRFPAGTTRSSTTRSSARWRPRSTTR